MSFSSDGVFHDLACKKSTELFHEKIYDLWLNKKEALTDLEIKQFILDNFKTEISTKNLTTIEEVKFTNLILDYFNFITQYAPKKLHIKTITEKIALLAALEIGDRSTNERRTLQDEFQLKQNEISNFISTLDLKCQGSQKPSSSSPLTSVSQPLPGSRSVESLKSVFATAYQSCSVLELDPINKNTPDLEGIKTDGMHEDGHGKKRVYSDIPLLLKTHYYYQNIETPKQQCFDARKSPLIYDYGGKPESDSSENSLLNFFKDSGSGTSVLGIDCSGYVGSIVAHAGLRLAPNKNFKAIQVTGLSSAMFADPKNNGLTCFNKITMNKNETIKPGDIIAGSGHVVMIDSVGADPFGLEQISNVENCIEGPINHTNFNFVISHSSSYKNAMGITRSAINDYLNENLFMQKGLMKYAIAACIAKFTAPGAPKKAEVSIVRHSETADCLLPKPIGLKYESCISDCLTKK